MRRVAIVFAMMCGTTAAAATVQYNGLLQEGSFPPSPPNALADDYVIAGTFAPGFNVVNYKYTYGDSAGNPHPNHYQLAVADGNFRPLGTGAIADINGAFAGSGTGFNIDDLPVYIFCFDIPTPGPSFSAALVSSTDPSWRVQNNGSTTIDTATANIFIFGGLSDGRINITLLPIPEPTFAVLSLGALALLAKRQCGW